MTSCVTLQILEVHNDEFFCSHMSFILFNNVWINHDTYVVNECYLFIYWEKKMLLIHKIPEFLILLD